MSQARPAMEGTGDEAGAAKLDKHMAGIAAGLARDPQLEAALRCRTPELELKLERDRSIGQELEQSIGGGRDRNRGMSR